MGCASDKEKLEDEMMLSKLKRMEIQMEKEKELKKLSEMQGQPVKRGIVPDYIDPVFAQENKLYEGDEYMMNFNKTEDAGNKSKISKNKDKDKNNKNNDKKKKKKWNDLSNFIYDIILYNNMIFAGLCWLLDDIDKNFFVNKINNNIVII